MTKLIFSPGAGLVYFVTGCASVVVRCESTFPVRLSVAFCADQMRIFVRFGRYVTLRYVRYVHARNLLTLGAPAPSALRDVLGKEIARCFHAKLFGGEHVGFLSLQVAADAQMFAGHRVISFCFVRVREVRFVFSFPIPNAHYCLHLSACCTGGSRT